MTPLIPFGPVYFKHEDQNPTGSSKDRALSLQIEHLKTKGYTSAVISSTGNAAISAQYYCSIHKIPLTIFLSPKTNPSKLKLLTSYHLSSKPISDAIKYAKANHSYFLRQSTNPIALIGYQNIGKEIFQQLPQITSLFVPVGSGTTLLGISQVLPKIVKIFAVQPASHCPIASVFDKNFIPETETITDSLGAKYLPLKNRVLKAIFSAIVVQNAEVSKLKISSSPEGALAYAGYLKAKDLFDVGNFPVILLTAKKR